MRNAPSVAKPICILYPVCILVSMFKKDKFSLAQVQVINLGKVENAKMIIPDMTGRVALV